MISGWLLPKYWWLCQFLFVSIFFTAFRCCIHYPINRVPSFSSFAWFLLALPHSLNPNYLPKALTLIPHRYYHYPHLPTTGIWIFVSLPSLSFSHHRHLLSYHVYLSLQAFESPLPAAPPRWLLNIIMPIISALQVVHVITLYVTAQYSTVQFNAMWYCTTIQYSIEQCNMMLSVTIQYNTLHYTTMYWTSRLCLF